MLQRSTQTVRALSGLRRPKVGFGRPKAGAVVVGLLLLASVVLGIGPAHAQSNCALRADLIDKLGRGFDEHPIALGLASTGNVLEVLISDDGTWTILITNPQGMACIAATGEHWQSLDKVARAGESS